MKTILPHSRSRTRDAGFTLVELLVVIAIIAILAAMTLTAVNLVKIKAQKAKAKLEANAIVTAIEGYDSAYGRFPASSATQTAAGTNDFTYGGSVLGTSDNSEVIAILMDSTQLAVNANHIKNPQGHHFLTAAMVSDPTLPGIGPDLAYRDPWGNPYIISMDLNYDDQCADAMYSLKAVSQQSGQTGYNGLVNTTDTGGNGDHFQHHGKIMVWSAGPDKKIDTSAPANAGLNKDNVLSWQ